MNKKNKKYNNKGPKYFEKVNTFQKKLHNFFKLESKRKYGKRLTNERR